MKKLLILLLFLLFFVSGCSSSSSKTSKNYIKQSDLKGYWLQIEEDWSGDVTDLSDNKYSYLEITNNRLLFYKYYSDTESYGLSDKYYILEENKLYYDYYELKGNDWKEKIDELSGGIFNVSIDEGKLILTKYYNDKNKDDGYETNTYKKIEAKDWPIEE